MDLLGEVRRQLDARQDGERRLKYIPLGYRPPSDDQVALAMFALHGLVGGKLTEAEAQRAVTVAAKLARAPACPRARA